MGLELRFEREKSLIKLQVCGKNFHTQIATKFCYIFNQACTEVFGSTGFGNNELSGITDISAIPK